MIAVSNNTLPQVSSGKPLSVATAVCRESFAAAAAFPSLEMGRTFKTRKVHDISMTSHDRSVI